MPEDWNPVELVEGLPSFVIVTQAVDGTSRENPPVVHNGVRVDDVLDLLYRLGPPASARVPECVDHNWYWHTEGHFQCKRCGTVRESVRVPEDGGVKDSLTAAPVPEDGAEGPTWADVEAVAARLGYEVDAAQCGIQGTCVEMVRPVRPGESLFGMPVAGPVRYEVVERHFWPHDDTALPEAVARETDRRAFQRAIWDMESDAAGEVRVPVEVRDHHVMPSKSDADPPAPVSEEPEVAARRREFNTPTDDDGWAQYDDLASGPKTEEGGDA